MSLRKEQVDLENAPIYPGGEAKTEGSSAPVSLSRLACEALRRWMEVSDSSSPYLFPSPRNPSQPVRRVKRAWKKTLERAGVAHFPLYQMRHLFCTRLSAVASDAEVQQAMGHSSPETKRRYQLAMTHQVRERIEQMNGRVYGGTQVLQFYDSGYDSRRGSGKQARK